MILIKNILKYSKEIIITYLLSYILIFISALIYTLLGYKDLTNFLNTTCSQILIIYFIITIIYLLKKNHQKEKKIPSKKYFPLISLGLSISILLNMLIFLIYPPQTSATIPSLTLFISSGIVGPIYEEILFRYLLYNRLAKVYSKKKALFITTILFSLIHLSPIKIIYAFILGIILNFTYQKHRNLIAPILIHIAANTIALFLYEYNTYILILSLISTLLSIKITTSYNNKNI